MIRKIVLEKQNIKKTGVKEGLNLYEEKNQSHKVNQLYLNETFIGGNEISKDIKKKMSGYKNQDTKKGRINDTCFFITYEETLEKLVVSKMKCYYCNEATKLMHENRRDDKQWTLDRIDNTLCHTSKNTVICCLKCNLEKRCRNDKKFKFSKQMRIIKEN